MTHLDRLPEDATPELADKFETFEEILGFVPNSLLVMQRKPEIVEGFDYLTRKVMQEADDVDPGFKRLAAHMASSAAGCQYCEAHSLVAADLHGVSQAKPTTSGSTRTATWRTTPARWPASSPTRTGTAANTSTINKDCCSCLRLVRPPHVNDKILFYV